MGLLREQLKLQKKKNGCVLVPDNYDKEYILQKIKRMGKDIHATSVDDVVAGKCEYDLSKERFVIDNVQFVLKRLLYGAKIECILDSVEDSTVEYNYRNVFAEDEG